ncbi:TackOD1 domain-containing metal-binding protein [Vibrio algicola]|uniref:Thaumarchaeal output domain-containing protein n=1 Tax=Vibrio algicola TaxID=2662262 RepID=A0A5Q0TIV3_9VIBR|nr:hypothetical protein [Vibrio algicola]
MTELNKHSASVCLISANEPEQDKLLQSIHQLEHTHTWQIYVMKESTLSAHLSDGLWSENEWEAKWQQHQKRLSHLNDRQTCPILTWLWLDEKRSLLPVKDHHTDQVYYYPLIDCYYPALQSAQTYVVAKLKNQLLQTEDFIDRIRHCPECDSAHLNYVETCVYCHSADIQLFWSNRSGHLDCG